MSVVSAPTLRFFKLVAGAWLALLSGSTALAQVTGHGGPPEEPKPALPVFEFHSGFWVNLHHFLYQQARLHIHAPLSTGAGAAAPESEKPALVPVDTLSAPEQQAWKTAVDYYARDLAGRDLLFNGDMVILNNRLAEMEACEDLSGRRSSECASGLRPDLIATLERAAPVFRARWWAEHDRVNRAWIAAISPRVRELGAELSQEIAATYQALWPAERFRVDVVNYGGTFGAYTSLDPVHLTISSTDARNQGSAALEVLFHEASHALAGTVRDAIVRECRLRGKPIPRDLWHALLFYTTGEIVRRTLSAARATEAATYTPYAYRFGLYTRGWSNFQRVLERYWQPYLDGKADFETALARLVSAL